MNTASANFRPGNSATCLRRKLPKSSMKKPKGTEEKSAKMDPADDSFNVSPINDVKYDSNKKS